MKTIKSLALFLLVSLTCNAFGMEQDWLAAEEETESNVSSLRKLCAKRAAQLIQEDPAFCEKEGQPKLTKEAKKLVVLEFMKDHPIIPLILQKLKIAPPKISSPNTNPAISAGFSSNGSQTLAISWDNTAKLWDIQTRACIRTFSGHTDRVESAVFSPDGSQILTASHDNTAKLWDVQTGDCIHTFSGHTDRVLSAVFSPDGLQILTASRDCTAKLWDAQTGAYIRTFSGHTDRVLSAVFSPDASQILTVSIDNTAKLWDKNTGACIHTFSDHTSWIMSAVVSPDGSQILTASWDNTAKLWDITPILQMIHYLTDKISLEQATLLGLIQKKITKRNMLSSALRLNEKQLELFNDLRPEIKTILEKQAKSTCTIV